MRGKRIALSTTRKFIGDLMHFAVGVPTVPVQRQMQLPRVVAAREQCSPRPGWPAVFLKGYATVAQDMPALRRAYVKLPVPHLREYPVSVASVAVEREYAGEPSVFFGRVHDPVRMSLCDLHARVRQFADAPIESIKPFKKLLAFANLPLFIRRPLMWMGLNLPRTRPGQFGTYGLSVYSSLGADSLHPISPLTTTLNYGVITPDGSVTVRLIYDHRVFDGSTAARALRALEEVLNGPILNELLSSSTTSARAA